MLRPALHPGETTVDLLNDLFFKDAQLWIAFEAGKPLVAVVTQIATEHGRKVCNIWAVGGSGLNKCFNNLSTIEAWAKSEGCAAVTVDHGRPGWQRLMDGYKVTHVSLAKEL